MGRKANDTYDEFKQLYYQHPKGKGTWRDDKVKLINVFMICTNQKLE